MFKQMKDFIVEKQNFISSKEKVMDNFIDPMLTVAIVDRLAHRIHIMYMSREISYRMKDTIEYSKENA